MLSTRLLMSNWEGCGRKAIACFEVHCSNFAQTGCGSPQKSLLW